MHYVYSENWSQMQKYVFWCQTTVIFVIFHREKEKSYRKISALWNLSKSTVAAITRRFQRDRIESIPQIGRPRIWNIRERRQVVRKIQNNPRLSIIKLTVEVSKVTGERFYSQTIRRTLKENGCNVASSQENSVY